MTPTTPEALGRLARLEMDMNLRHSGARWRAHEVVWPGRGAAEIAETYAEADAEQAVRIEKLLAATREKSPEATTDIAYLEWVLSELRPES